MKGTLFGKKVFCLKTTLVCASMPCLPLLRKDLAFFALVVLYAKIPIFAKQWQARHAFLSAKEFFTLKNFLL
jgi:hypothetical protein